MTKARGLDIGGDGLIDPAKVVGAGYSFVIHRVIRESGKLDVDFKENMRRCTEAGLTFGTYFWPGPGHAQKFLAVCPPNPAFLPPAIDLETNPRGLSRSAYWTQAHQNLVDIEKAWNPDGIAARHTMIYGGRDWLSNMLPLDDPNVGGHPLWFAHPGSSMGALPPQWTEAVIWQNVFGENGGWEGLDSNLFLGGDHAALVKHFQLKAG